MSAGSPQRLDLPPAFLEKNLADPAWLAALPALLTELAERWAIRVGTHVPGIIYNYVAPATRADGTRCILKVSRHVDETRNEIAALQLWNGEGAARLIAAEPERGALLLERLQPGTMLTAVAEERDDTATRIAASVLRRLWRPARAGDGLRPLASWLGAYDRNRDALARGAGGFPAALFQRADALCDDLLASTSEDTVLHGDLHHFNVLLHRPRQAGRRAALPEDEQWLAIDPKGLAGDRCFDVCQFFRNPLPRGVPLAVITRRLNIFCHELALERRRVKDWCLVHAVLDACWDFEDGRPWQQAVAYAEATLSF
ncbi:MAG TPA: aminoglycoside phosphotransferase family protein [Dehalococcoidia bacterium]|nr:aminoglycoside phosphotransferase family protein [Dehalococcoidia bacterium]